jgi:hypothetical protein
LKKSNYLVIFAIMAIFFSLQVFSGCTQESSKIEEITNPKASVKDVELFDKKPCEDQNKHDQFIAQEKLGKKNNRIMKYKILASGYVNDKEYLKKHPEDGLIISSSNSSGRSDVRVYTNNPVPDPQFFK